MPSRPTESKPVPDENPMPQSDKRFYIISGTGLVVLSTGLWIGFGEHAWWPSGLCLTVLGLIISVISAARTPKLKTAVGRSEGVVIIICALMAAGLCMLDIYSRYNGDRTIAKQKSQIQSLETQVQKLTAYRNTVVAQLIVYEIARQNSKKKCEIE